MDFATQGVMQEVREGAGAVLFLGSARPPKDLAGRISALLRAAPPGSRPLVMADEEGGGVQRLAGAVSNLPWPRQMAATMTPQAVRAAAARLGQEMRGLGVTVDLAPVADVDAGPGPSARNPDGARSFSGDPVVAGKYAVAFALGLQDGGVVPVVKHFPGLGGSSGNTDSGSARTRELSRLRTTGLLPFQAVVRAGVPAVMISNASVPGLTTLPSSIAAAVVSDLLKHGLGFHGLVVTDSLSAGALTDRLSVPDAAASALSAGADLVLYGSTLTASQTQLLSPENTLRTFHAIVQAVTAAAADGSLPPARLVDAALAVLRVARVQLCP